MAVAVLVAISVLLSAPHAAAQQTAVEFNIPAQPISSALRAYAQQAKVQLIVLTEGLDLVESNAVAGRMAPREALQMLLDGTDLQPEYRADATVAVKRGAYPGRPVTSASGDTQSNTRWLAQSRRESAEALTTPQAARARNQRSRRADKDREESTGKVPLEEIVVTGTNIRGVHPSASTIRIFDRSEIDASGYATLNQFIQTVPQNFGGGPNENGAASTSPVGQGSPTEGTGINLRGLGSDATLTLINGRRVGASGDGRFVDISSIPVSAIERIEILTDGASAIYGSDAIGGVANIILRDNYDGAESRIIFSTTSDGVHRRAGISNTLGTDWDEGNVLISYEYYRQSELNSNDREFVESAPDPQFLLPRLNRHSVFASARQRISDGIQLSGQGYFNHRDVDTATARVFPARISADAQQLGLVGALDIGLPAEWHLSLSGSYSESHDQKVTAREDGSVSQDLDSVSRVISADILADGGLIDLPGGEVGAAIGGQFRHEFIDPLLSNSHLRRDVYAVFGEIIVPLVGENNAVPGVQSLELSAAGRFEHYSDFGHSSNPKVGLAWKPVRDITIRGTYGTSFRAPRLIELQEGVTNSFVFPAFDFVIGEVVPAFFVANNSNPNLNPETASTWTIGADLQPEGRPGFQASVTYFNVEFKDRIEIPCPDLLSCLQSEFALITPRDPEPSLLRSIVTETNYIDFGTELTDVRALVYATLGNTSSLEVGGFDSSILYSFLHPRAGRFSFAVNGTYFLNYDRRVFPGAAPVSILNTAYNPPNLKLRGQIGWEGNALSVVAFVNHTAGYENKNVSPTAPVDSWTTVDVNLSLDVGERSNSSLARGIILSLGVTNLFDANPPIVENNLSEIDFDGANANAVGRLVTLNVTKKW